MRRVLCLFLALMCGVAVSVQAGVSVSILTPPDGVYVDTGTTVSVNGEYTSTLRTAILTFYVDNIPQAAQEVAKADLPTPYPSAFQWDTTLFSLGKHTLKVKIDGGECGTDTAEIEATVFKASIKSITFTSDHGVLTTYDLDYAGTNGTIFGSPDWRDDTGTDTPITQKRNTSLTANVVVKIQPEGLPFNLIGDGPDNYVDFNGSGTSTGDDLSVSVTAAAALPNQIATLTRSINWKVVFTNPDPDVEKSIESSGQHKVYVTWDTPGDGEPTLHRVKWVCLQADGKDTAEKIADALWDAVASQTTSGDLGTDGWALLDGGSGDCDNQARCMQYAVQLIGGSASVKYVGASTDAGPGNCLDYEERECPVHGPEKLLLDFYGGGTPGNMNQFEGCCVTACYYYAVTPKLKTANDYTLLLALGNLGVTQHYCWWDETIDWWRPCSESGSTPDIPSP